MELGGRIYEHSAADEFCDEPARGEGGGPYGALATTSSSPRTIRWSGLAGLTGATLFQTKLALYTSYVIAGRVPKGRDCRRAVVGHERSVPLPARRAASGLRRRDLRRRGSQDRPAGRHCRVLSPPRRAPRRDPSSRRGHASLVGPGDRDARWTAVHRAERRPSVRGHRVCRQRADVRDAGGHDDFRRHPRTNESLGRAVRSRAGRRSPADSGTTSRRTSITRTT